MSKMLVDTNVLVYAKDSSSIHHQASLNIFKGEDELYVASKTLNEYYSVVTRGEYPFLTPLEALQDLKEFVARLQVLYPTELSRQKLFQLINDLQPRGLKIHDFEIASIAIAHDIESLVTFNYSDFSLIKEIEVVIPK